MSLISSDVAAPQASAVASGDGRPPAVVHKYGGSSVANADRIRAVARRVARVRESGRPIAVVVSAMGKTTDQLIDLARQVSHHPDPRELDMLLHTGELVSCTLLAMALRDMGHEAVSLTGLQAGIFTDDAHSKARIVEVRTDRLEQELARGRVAIVAGFQGWSPNANVTTLGRGGSDTTAVAVAAALRAEVCEIYTDVTGVFTADPRIVPTARQLPEISYEEMEELAISGAKVMHPRAVELGQLYNLPILVLSSFEEAPGTLIHESVSMEQQQRVRGIAHQKDVAKITFIAVPDRPGIAARIFEPLADAHINVDIIVQNTGIHGLTDLSFTVAGADLYTALEISKAQVGAIQAREVQSATGLAKVSIVGTGIYSQPGYAAQMFRALADAGVNIEMITTSDIRITCLIQEAQVEPAVRALHAAFRLDEVDQRQPVARA